MDSLLGKTTVAKQLEAYFGIVRVDPEMVVELAIAYAIAGKKIPLPNFALKLFVRVLIQELILASIYVET